MSAEHETTTVVLCGSSVLWSDSAFFLPAPGRNDIDGRNELFVLSAFDSSAAASSPSLGFGAAPSRVTTICTTPFASRSSCAPCCGVVTGRPLTTWTTSPILSFFDRAASPPGRISATTTPLRVASAGGSNVRPKTSVSDGFQMSISFGTGFLPCRKDESARPNVDTERLCSSPSSSSSSSASFFFLPRPGTNDFIEPSIVFVRDCDESSPTWSSSSMSSSFFALPPLPQSSEVSPMYFVSPDEPAPSAASPFEGRAYGAAASRAIREDRRF